MEEPTGMRVTQLWRHPVKSAAGESVAAARIGPLGIDGDRRFGLVDLDTGMVLTARRAPDLLFAVPVVVEDGDEPGDAGTRVRLRLPDGTVTAEGDVLSAWLNRPVALREAAADERGRYEIAVNDDRPDGEWMSWEGPEGVFHDSARTRVSILSEDHLGDWDVRRFRANVVVRGGDERDLLGCRIRIGSVELEVVKEIDRCVIVTRPQPGLERDKDVLVKVHQERGGNLGVGATVQSPGTVTVGDEVLLTA